MAQETNCPSELDTRIDKLEQKIKKEQMRLVQKIRKWWSSGAAQLSAMLKYVANLIKPQCS